MCLDSDFGDFGEELENEYFYEYCDAINMGQESSLEEEDECFEEQMSNMTVREMYSQIVDYAQKLIPSDTNNDPIICPQCLKFGHYFRFQCSDTFNQSLVSYKNGDTTSEVLEYIIFEGAHELIIHVISHIKSEDSILIKMAYKILQHISWYCQEHFSENALIMRARHRTVVPYVNRLQEIPLEKDEVPSQEEDEHEEELLILEDMQLLDMWEQVDYCSGNLSSSFEGMRQYNDKPNRLYDFECIPLFKEFLSSNTHINGNNVELLEYIVYEGSHELLRKNRIIMKNSDNEDLERYYNIMDYIVNFCQKYFSGSAL